MIRSLIKGLGRQTRENLFLFDFQLHRVYPRKMQFPLSKAFCQSMSFMKMLNSWLFLLFSPLFVFFSPKTCSGRAMINLEDSYGARNWKYSIEISRTLFVQFKSRSMLHEISNFQGFICVMCRKLFLLISEFRTNIEYLIIFPFKTNFVVIFKILYLSNSVFYCSNKIGSGLALFDMSDYI